MGYPIYFRRPAHLKELLIQVRSGEKKNLDLALDTLANKLAQSKQAHHTPLNQRYRMSFFFFISNAPVP
jgi:hypothetical protein